jgi:soluble lytic murein transglycosylase-like protein
MRELILIFIFLAGLSFYFFRKKILPGAKGLTPELESVMASKADQYGVDRALVKAIARVESNFNPRAKNPADPSYGLMQITPMLAQDYNLVKDYRHPSSFEIERLYDLDNNLYVGCSQLAHLTRIRPFDSAVQMYNVGQTGYMNGVRNYDYLNKVRSYYEKYRSV